MAMDANSQGSSDAISQGRRIYLGNLLYSAEAPEIEDSLLNAGFDDFETIHLSVDPVSGRNPGYCFVDFATREAADRALDSLDASVGGRTLKVGPCRPKQARNATTPGGRWGGADGRSSGFQGQGHRAGSSSSYGLGEDAAGEDFARCVYVGGLPASVDQALDAAEVTELFAGFSPLKISNRIKPHESTSALPGNHHYCFVDFATSDEAQSAIEALNGKETEAGPLKVSAAKPPPNRQQRDQRSSPYNSGGRFGQRPRRGPRDQEGGAQQQGEALAAGSRSMASDNWRRKGD